MKRISYSSLALAAVMMLATGLAIADPITCPGYTPTPNSAVVTARVFNDCDDTSLQITNAYPASICIIDSGEGCTGTNLHIWSFSEDGVTKAAFENCSHYRFGAVFKMCTQYGEGGLRLSPWWSPDVDGRFMVNVASGEIACFGGRLPFYSFTAAYGLHYVQGQEIWMQITYDPNELEETDPALPAAPNAATIEYQIFYQGQGYSSGKLSFDMANPAEAAEHGVWGELYPAYVGGYVQAPNWNGGAAFCTAVSWTNIEFEGPSATPAKSSTWGQLKNLYR
jgi:hypothetical protein